MKAVVFYHGDCPDGFCSAWIAHRALVGQGLEVVLIPCKWGDKLDLAVARGRLVYCVDFSFTATQLFDIAAVAKEIHVLDHHETTIRDLYPHTEALELLDVHLTLNTERSGAGLAWDEWGEYIITGTTFPRAKRMMAIAGYVEDRDLWRFRLNGTRAISAFISSIDQTIIEWDRMLDCQIVELVAMGETVMRYKSKLIREIAAGATMIQLNGYSIPAVAAPYSLGSDVCALLNDRYPDAPFAAYFVDRPDGSRQYGLRSSDNSQVNLSRVAEEHGGGGHFHAAGFTKPNSGRTK